MSSLPCVHEVDSTHNGHERHGVGQVVVVDDASAHDDEGNRDINSMERLLQQLSLILEI